MSLHAAALVMAPGAGAAGTPTHYLVTRSGSNYTATPSPSGTTHTGTLKSVVERAVTDLEAAASPSSRGTVEFVAGDFNLGTDHFEFYDIHDLNFVGAGMDQTTLRNSTSVASDTEPFDVSGAFRVTVRDMTVMAGGAYRSTSDALDFDEGNDVVIDRIRVPQSRARGIVFDGKNAGWTADRNVIRNCVITGVPMHGIELLASSNNRVENCVITNVAANGIYLSKASAQADQANKKSTGNTIINNEVDQAGQNGVAVNSGDRNTISGNTITNSSDDVSSRDGIRIFTSNSITSDDNVVTANTATDNQSPKTQKYGLNIVDAQCRRTVVGTNNFAGNLTAPIRDLGTGTSYQSTPDAQAPTVPGNVSATADGPFSVSVAWTASTDNVAVNGYGIYRNGSLVGEVGGSTLSFTDTTVAAGSTYGYQVDAVDAAGNRSARTATVNVTTPPQGGTTLTLVPSEDSYVNEASPTTNYGASTSLRVDGSPIVRSYLKVSIPAVAVTAATLKIYATSSSTTGIQAYASNGAAWTESTINYSNAPGTSGSALDSTGAFSGNTYVALDVTPLVAAGAGGVIDIIVVGPGSTAIGLSSSESANVPQLVVTTS